MLGPFEILEASYHTIERRKKKLMVSLFLIYFKIMKPDIKMVFKAFKRLRLGKTTG